MQDVAREAKLSVASVSRALSGAGGRQVGEDVLKQVRRAAARLRYELNPIARALRVGHSDIVALVVPDIASPFFSMLASGLEAVLREARLGMFLLDAGNDPAIERQCIGQLVARRVDKIIVSPVHATRSRANIDHARSYASLVQIDRYASLNAHRVITDPVKTIQLPLDHLTEQGCARFVFVGAADSASVSIDRLNAYRDLLKQRDKFSHKRTLSGSYSVEWGQKAASEMLKRWPDIDAVICADDLIALGVIQGLQAAGREVPRQIAVAGCDDTFFAANTHPRITSVKQPVGAMAARALELLMNGADEPAQAVLIEPELCVRDSTARVLPPLRIGGSTDPTRARRAKAPLAGATEIG
ncbi:MAG TPA: LacI family DNA-binding transcriptional regulator [Roseiarcus sp.]|nr:LacI family DNA-binding transcriptional regulator [Roseiarcus sp.]